MSDAPVAKPSGKQARLEIDLAERLLKFRDAARTALEDAKGAGDILAELKGIVPRGEWSVYLEDKFDLSVRTAQVYMQISDGWAIVKKSAAAADLTLAGAVKLLAKPKKIEPDELVPEPDPEEETSDAPEPSAASPHPTITAKSGGSSRRPETADKRDAQRGDDGASDSSPRLATTEEVCPTCNGTGKVAVREGWVELRDAFEAGFIAATGSKPSWGPKEGNQLKAVLRRQPVEECLRRLHIFFGPERPGFLSTYDLQTFVGHFDKFANPAVAAKQVVRDPAIDRLMLKAKQP